MTIQIQVQGAEFAEMVGVPGVVPRAGSRGQCPKAVLEHIEVAGRQTVDLPQKLIGLRGRCGSLNHGAGRRPHRDEHPSAPSPVVELQLGCGRQPDVRSVGHQRHLPGAVRLRRIRRAVAGGGYAMRLSGFGVAGGAANIRRVGYAPGAPFESSNQNSPGQARKRPDITALFPNRHPAGRPGSPPLGCARVWRGFSGAPVWGCRGVTAGIDPSAHFGGPKRPDITALFPRMRRVSPRQGAASERVPPAGGRVTLRL